MEEDYQSAQYGVSLYLLVLTSTSPSTILLGILLNRHGGIAKLACSKLILTSGYKYFHSETKQCNFYVLDLLLISTYKVQKAFPVSVTSLKVVYNFPINK